jgi:hypothetical protein
MKAELKHFKDHKSILLKMHGYIDRETQIQSLINYFKREFHYDKLSKKDEAQVKFVAGVFYEQCMADKAHWQVMADVNWTIDQSLVVGGLFALLLWPLAKIIPVLLIIKLIGSGGFYLFIKWSILSLYRFAKKTVEKHDRP